MSISRILVVWILSLCSAGVAAADWPQFMRTSTRAGDAATEELHLPLRLATCVRLDDAVTTAPAIVGGKVYVVDQMGTAYCIDPMANRILWKSSPDGRSARGGNTSSLCVYQGRAYFGTTAGRFHVLNARDGKVIRSIDIGSPITGSPVVANKSIYFQSLHAVVYCLDQDGRERWRWNHYKSYQDPKTNKRATGFPGSYHDPHYAGGELAVAGKRIVVNMGWDLFCLEDAAEKPRLIWCNRAPLGKDPGIPMGPAICGDWVYCGHPGTDQFGGFMRVRLDTGKFDERKDFRYSGYPGSIWAVFATPAVRDSTVFIPSHYMGVQAYDYAKHRRLWYARKDNSLDQRGFTGSITSPALSRNHCVFGTIHGELHVVPLTARGHWPKFKPAAFTFRTPFGKPISSSPAISNGAVYFGCDDGFLYGLSTDGKLDMPGKTADLHTVRTRNKPATGKPYGAPVASMDQANSGSVDDPNLKPPLRVRWAMRPFDLRVQMSADEHSLYFISEAGTMAAVEQATGRIRWRKRLNGPVDGWKQMLLFKGRLYVTRASHRESGKLPKEGGASLSAFDADTGKQLWQVPWGFLQGTCRTAPVAVGDVVAGITILGKPPKPIVQAFDRTTGRPLWRLELPGTVPKKRRFLMSGGACVLNGTMFFSCGQTWGDGPGSTMAVDPKTGKVLWSTEEYHIHGYGRPAARNGFLYLGGQSGAAMYCLSTRDGKLKWKADRVSYSHSPALGKDYFVTRSYGGYGILRELATGKPVIRNGKHALGGCPDHSCAPVLLTSGRISYAVSSSGLYARDVDTGKILWQSLGFAPRACTTPIAASGRLFFSPNVNNMLYCFEPK